MPSLLNSGVGLKGTSGTGTIFITLPGAQLSLGNTPTTSTGYTLVTGPNGQLGFTSTLGGISFNNGIVQSQYPNGTLTIQSTGTGTVNLIGDVLVNGSSITSLIASASSGTFGTVTVTSSTQSTGTDSGALTVAGGVGIGGNIWAGGNADFYGQLSAHNTVTFNPINGNVTMQPTGVGTVIINPASLGTIDNMSIGAFTPAGGTFTNLVVLNTATINFLTATSAAITTLNVSGTSTFTGILSANNITVNNTVTTNYLTVNNTSTLAGQVLITDTSPASSTATGALVVSGGAGFDGSVYVKALYINGNPAFAGTFNGGEITDPLFVNNPSGSTSTTTGAITTPGGVGVGGSLYASQLYDSGHRVVTDVVASGSTYIGIDNLISTGTSTSFTINNLGVTNLNSGTDITLSATTGSITINNTSTLQTVTNRGATTTNAINISNTSSTALQIAGGATVGTSLYANSVYDNNNRVVTQVTPTSGLGIGISDLVSTGTATSFTINNVGVTNLNGSTGTITISVGTDTTLSTASGSILIYSTSTLQSVTNRGATTTNAISITNATSSTSTNTGALTVTGGVGIGGALYAGTMTSNGSLVVTTSTLGLYGVGSVAAGTDTAVSTATGIVTVWSTATLNSIMNRTGGNTSSQYLVLNSTSASSNTFTGALIVQGGVGIGGSLYAGNIYSNGSQVITTGTLVNYGVSTITAGTDTAVSTSSGVVTIWNTSNLQSVTDRGAATTNAIQINNSSANTGTGVSNALYVQGGAYIGNTLAVQGTAYFGGNVVFGGTATYVYSTNTYYTDNILELHVPPGGPSSLWPIDDGKDIGLRFHYFNRALNTDTNAALVLAADSQVLEWYGTGVEDSTSTVKGSYGSFRTGSITLLTTSSSTSTGTGALIVRGGVGVSGAIYANGMYDTNNRVVTSVTPTGGTGIGIASVITTGTAASFTINNVGVTNLNGNTGTITISVGTDTTISTASGSILIYSTATLNSITNRAGGNTTSNIIVINNTSASTSTTTGALQVAGGVGIQGTLNVGGAAYIAGDLYVNSTSLIVNNTNIASTNKVLYLATAASTASAVNSGLAVGSTSSPYVTFYFDGASSWKSSGNIIPNGTVGLGALSTPWNVIYGTAVYDSGNRVVTSVTPTGGTGIGIASLSANGTGATFTINNVGVTSLASGTDITVSATTGSVTINNTSTLQTVTGRGATTTNAISITNTATSTSTNTTQALLVTGGIGAYRVVANQIYGDAIYDSNARVLTTASLVNFGVTSIIAGTDTAISTSTGIVTIWDTSTLATVTGRGATTNTPLTVNGGITFGSTSSAAISLTGTYSAPSGNIIKATGTMQPDGTSAAYFFTGQHSLRPTTSTINTYYGLLFLPTLDNTSTYGTMYGNFSRLDASANATTGSAVSTWVGYTSQNPTKNALAQTTVTTHIGFQALDPSSFTITNVYGFQSSISSAGGGARYNIYASGSANNYFAGNVGIGVAPSYKLDVSGGTRLAGTVLITDTSVSTSTNTSQALLVSGGIGANIIYATQIYDNNNRVVTQVTPTSGTGIGISNLVSTGTATSFTINNVGVTSLNGSTGTLNIIAGTDTAISTATGSVTINSTATLQSITNRGFTTTSLIRFTNTVTSTGTTSGALVVTGGVGIGDDLWVNNLIYSQGSQVLTTATFGNFGVASLNGTTGTVSLSAGTGIAISTTTAIVTITNIGVTSLSTTGTGISVTTSTGSVTISNTDTLQTVTARGSSTNLVVTISNTSIGSNTNTGQALLVSGGIGANAVYAGLLYDNGNRVITQVAVTAGGGLAGGGTINGPTGSVRLDNVGVTQFNGATGTVNVVAGTAISISTSSGTTTINNVGVTATFGTTYLGVSTSTGSVTFTNLGVQTLTAGTDTAVNYSTGTVVVWNTSTLNSITNRAGGNTTSNIIIINNTSASTSTITGALQVVGGVGIGGNAIHGGYGRFNGAYDENASTTTVAVYIGVGGNAPVSPRIGFANSGTTWQIDNYNGNFRWFTPGVTRMQLDASGILSVYTNTNATTTTNGALVVGGGAGFSGDVYAYNIYSNNARVLTTATIGNYGVSLLNGFTGTINIQAGNAISITTSANTIIVGNVGTTATYGSSYIAVSANTGSVTIYNLGVAQLNGSTGTINISVGTDTTISTASGSILIYSTATLNSIMNRTGGNTSSQYLVLNNTSASSNTTTGALIVAGGIGAGGAVNIGGTVTGAINGTNGTAFLAGNGAYNNIALGMQVASGPANMAIRDLSTVSSIMYFDSSVNTSTGGSFQFRATSGYTQLMVLTTASLTVNTPLTSITSNTNSTGTNSGALQVVGGVGIGGDLYVGGLIYSQNARVLTTATLGNFGVVSVNGATGTVNITAGTGIAVTTATGSILTITNIGVTSLSVTGTGISVTVNTGSVTISNTDTLQTVTARGATTTLPVSITSAATSTSTNTGALTVTGGVGIGKDLFVGGATYLAGDLYVDGTQFIVNSSYLATGDKTLTLSTGSISAILASGAGLQIGSTGTPYISWLYDGVSQWVSSGGIKSTNTLTVISTATALSTTTGALIVSGGAGIGGALYVGGLIYSQGAQVLTTATLGNYGVSSVNGSTGSINIQVGTYLGISTSSGIVTLNNAGVTTINGSTGSFNITSGAGIGISTSTGTITFTNTGVISLTTSGTGITVSSTTGTITITNTDTLQTVTGKGNSTTNITIFANTASTTSTNTGALQVVGGVGIGGGLYVGGVITATNFFVGPYPLSTGTSLTVQYNGVNLGTTVNTLNLSTGTTATFTGSTVTIQAYNAPIVVSTSTPSTASNGQLWWDSNVGNLRVYYVSTGSGAWVDAVPLTSGVTSVTAGTDTVAVVSGGSVLVWNTSTLQSITSRGSATTYAISITNTATSTGTTTGALIVSGGVGIGGTVSHRGLTPTYGLNIDQIYTTSTTLTLNTGWQATGISGSQLTTGTYMIQVLANDSAVGGGEVNTYYSGVMSWYAGTTTEVSYDEIVLHRAGAASSTGTVFLQVIRANGGNMSLQIAGTTANTSNSTYNFSFRRMI